MGRKQSYLKNKTNLCSFNWWRYRLDRISENTDQALMIYASLQAANLALLSNLVHQNSKTAIQLLKAVPQENRLQQKLVAGLSAVLVAGINLLILERMIHKVLTIVPGIFILSRMNNPEKGVVFRAEALPYLSNQNKQCNLLFLNGLDVEEKAIDNTLGVVADLTLIGGNKPFQLCNVHMAVVRTAAEFISALQKGKDTFGKIENLIIDGHGNGNQQKIGSFLFSPNETPELIEEMKNTIERNASVILGGCMSADLGSIYSPDTYAGRVAKLLKGPTVYGFIGSFLGQQVGLMVENGRLVPSMTVRTVKTIDLGSAFHPPEATFHPAGMEKVVAYQENPADDVASKISGYLPSFF